MNWDELSGFWKDQVISPAERQKLISLAAAFEVERQKRERGRRLRDISEAATGLLLAGLLAGVGWRLNVNGGRLALTIGFLLVPVGCYVRERVRSRRWHALGAEPLLSRIDHEIAELQHQSDLFRRIGLWYLAPLLVSAVMGVATFCDSLPTSLRSAFWADGATRAWIIFFAVGFVGLLFWTWLRVRRDLSAQLDPLLADLKQMRHVFDPK
jgi:hypothetical protein